jgi:hypothetical protein
VGYVCHVFQQNTLHVDFGTVLVFQRKRHIEALGVQHLHNQATLSAGQDIRIQQTQTGRKCANGTGTLTE